MDHSRDDRYRSLDLSLRSPPVSIFGGMFRGKGRDCAGSRIWESRSIRGRIRYAIREREFQFLGFFVYLEIYLE